MTAKIFLDTCSIIALSGLKEKEEFDLLRNRLEECKSGLFASHIQGDEMHPEELSDFREIYRKTFEKFEKHGIKIHWEEPTRGMIIGVSRIGFCRIFEDDLAEIGEELEIENRKCMEEKGKFNKNIDEKAIVLNIARDCLIAITSLDYDYFITSDKCLYESWTKVLQRHKTEKKLKKTSEVIYVRRSPEMILKEILKILNSDDND
jgi:hypothetical protein